MVAEIVEKTTTKVFEQAKKRRRKREEAMVSKQQGTEADGGRGPKRQRKVMERFDGHKQVRVPSTAANPLNDGLTVTGEANSNIPANQRADDTKKRGPQLTTVPDERPVAKRRKQQANVEAVGEDITFRRHQHEEQLYVHNSISSGRKRCRSEL